MTSKGSFWTVTSLTQCMLFVNGEIGENNNLQDNEGFGPGGREHGYLATAVAEYQSKIFEVMEDLIAVLRDCQASLVGVVEQLEGKASKEL